MRILFLLLLVMACQPVRQIDPRVGECIIGQDNDIWKLIRKQEGVYMFASMPLQEGTPLEILRDLETFKKVECPY